MPGENQVKNETRPNYWLRRGVAATLAATAFMGAGFGLNKFADRNNEAFAAADEAATFAQPVPKNVTGLNIDSTKFRSELYPQGQDPVNIRTSPGAIGGCPAVNIPPITSSNCAGTFPDKGAQIMTDKISIVHRGGEKLSNGSNGTWYGVPVDTIPSGDFNFSGKKPRAVWISGEYAHLIEK